MKEKNKKILNFILYVIGGIIIFLLIRAIYKSVVMKGI